MENEPRRRLFNWRLFSQLAKVFVVLIVLVLGLQSFYAVRFHGSQGNAGQLDDVAPPENTVVSGANPTELFADLTSGAWRFGESEWEFKVYSQPAGFALTAPPTSFRDRDPAFDDKAVIDQFREIEAEPQPLGNGLEKWESLGQGMAMVLFTRDGVVQVLRTQIETGEGRTTIEAIPRQRQGKQSEVVLLPLIESARQTAVRFNPTGDVTSAIIQLDQHRQIEIRDHWRQAGWEVSPVIDLEFDAGLLPTTNTKYRCSKAGTIIDATFMSEPDEPQATIILNLVASATGSR